MSYKYYKYSQLNCKCFLVNYYLKRERSCSYLFVNIKIVNKSKNIFKKRCLRIMKRNFPILNIDFFKGFALTNLLNLKMLFVKNHVYFPSVKLKIYKNGLRRR